MRINITNKIDKNVIKLYLQNNKIRYNTHTWFYYNNNGRRGHREPGRFLCSTVFLMKRRESM